jgi:hypothetical protein
MTDAERVDEARQGRLFDSSIAATRFSALFSANRSNVTSCSTVSE